MAAKKCKCGRRCRTGVDNADFPGGLHMPLIQGRFISRPEPQQNSRIAYSSKVLPCTSDVLTVETRLN